MRGFIEDLGAGGIFDRFERGAAFAALGGEESAEAEGIGGQSAAYQRG
jgi:hypothetical protein